MNKRTIARIEAFQNTRLYQLSNNSKYAGFEPLEESVTEFGETLDEIEEKSEIKSKNTTGSAVDKTAVRNKLAEVTIGLAKKSIVWARKTKNWEAVAILDVEESDIKYGELQKSIDSAKNVHNVLTDNKDALGKYRIEGDQITALQTAITDMGIVEAKPRQSRDQRQLAGIELNKLIDVMDEIGENMDDLIVGEFKTSNPSFVEGYLIAKRIDDPAYRRTLLLLSVKNQEGLPVSGAWCDILEMIDEEQLTNNLGIAEIGAIKTGTYQLEVSKEGYQTFKTIFSIKRGNRISIEIVLQKA